MGRACPLQDGETRSQRAPFNVSSAPGVRTQRLATTWCQVDADWPRVVFLAGAASAWQQSRTTCLSDAAPSERSSLLAKMT